jgi:hypothetical protein
MLEFDIIDLLNCYSWPFIHICLKCLDDGKSVILKYLLNIFVHFCGFRIGGPTFFSARAPTHFSLDQPVSLHLCSRMRMK